MLTLQKHLKNTLQSKTFVLASEVRNPYLILKRRLNNLQMLRRNQNTAKAKINTKFYPNPNHIFHHNSVNK